MDPNNPYTSQISTDADPYVDESSQSGHRSRRDDPRGAIPRFPVHPASVPSSDQLYTGRGDQQKTAYTPVPGNLTQEEFIDQHYDKLPKELKVGYYDVMVLYSESDYEDAEKFRAHLENDIFVNEPGKIKAVLYDGPDLEGLSASKLQHLDNGFQRCTFTFVYLTKQFVDCDWCNLSSETCLMEAIYNKDKKWCVVPVYTVQRNKADFRIPMGLNSLKGINYYNPDEFYRKGVKRLIGDKIIKREENEKILFQKRYDYLVRKVQEDHEFEQRMQRKHEHDQQQIYEHQMQLAKEREFYNRSQSVMEQAQRNIIYTSGEAYPKTAGCSAQPPSFPPKYGSEGSDLSSMRDFNPKHNPELSSLQNKHRDSSQTEQTSMGYVSKDYASAPNVPGGHISGHYQASYGNPPREIHHHYHYPNKDKQEAPQANKIFNINAENVIIGENGKIIANGKPIDLEKMASDSSFRENLETIDVRTDTKSDQGNSTCFEDNGFQTGESRQSASGRSATENIDRETIKCVPRVNNTCSKEVETSLKSPAIGEKCKDNNSQNITKPIDSLHASKTDTLEKSVSKIGNRNTEIKMQTNSSDEDQPQNDNITQAVIKKPSSKPVKLPTRTTNSPPVATVQPITKSNPKYNVVKATAEEETELKQTGRPHETVPKLEYTEEQTAVKTPTASQLQQTAVKTPPKASQLRQTAAMKVSPYRQGPDENIDFDETEVLKAVQGQHHRKDKVSQSSLETDGCSSLSSSLEESYTILTKDDLQIEAVKSCLEMGYKQEDIRDALTSLRQLRPGHHHFAIHELLDILNGTLPLPVTGKYTPDKEEDNWVTLVKDEKSGECHEMGAVEASYHKNNASAPVKIQRSSTDPKLSSSQKSRSQKEKEKNCKMS